MQIPRGNGFVLATGISTFACQVQGMNLDYSRPTDTQTGVYCEGQMSPPDF
jgi:hypothetical protein